MATEYPPLKTNRLSGREQFHNAGDSLGFDVLSFWQWEASKLGANNLRGHLAEYLVSRDLGLSSGTRTEWDTCDLRTPDNIRIEVKSAAYIQQWHQKKLSAISFDIAPTKGWDKVSKSRTKTKQRNSDVYVFCLIETKDQQSFDPTDLSQWVFYVLPTQRLNRRLGPQKTISLSRLKRLKPVECRHGEIEASVRSCI
jgi:hypothetical protein